MKLKFKTPLNQQNYEVLTRKPRSMFMRNEKIQNSTLQPNDNSLPVMDIRLPLNDNSLSPTTSCLLSIDNTLSPPNNNLPLNDTIVTPANDRAHPTDIDSPIMTTFFVNLPLNVNKIEVGGRKHIILPKFAEGSTVEEKRMYCKLNQTVRKEIMHKLTDRLNNGQNEEVEPPNSSMTGNE